MPVLDPVLTGRFDANPRKQRPSVIEVCKPGSIADKIKQMEGTLGKRLGEQMQNQPAGSSSSLASSDIRKLFSSKEEDSAAAGTTVDSELIALLQSKGITTDDELITLLQAKQEDNDPSSSSYNPKSEFSGMGTRTPRDEATLAPIGEMNGEKQCCLRCRMM